MSTRNTKTYNSNADFVSKLGMPVVKLLDPKPNESILDLGCGDGILMQAIESQGAQTVGIDPSESFIASVQEKGMIGYVADARYLWFKNEFDAVFSNAAIHWMGDIHKVMKSIKQSLKPGGRFIGEFGGDGNIKTITDSIYQNLSNLGLHGKNIHSWYFASVEDFKDILHQYGFEVIYCERIVRPTALPTGLQGWLEQFAFPFTKIMKEELKSQFIRTVLEEVEPLLPKNEQGATLADYVRIRFKAILK